MAGSIFKSIWFMLVVVVALCSSNRRAEAGVIKDLFNKITGNNNKTEDVVKESAPICGSGIFSTPDESSLSPEFIFITNRPSRSEGLHSNVGDRNREYYGDTNERYRQRGNDSSSSRQGEKVNEVANEFRFHMENVTLEELERNGFNRNAPVTFLMHGFTSGYPLQAWMSAIVEAYTIDRESGPTRGTGSSRNHNTHQTQQGGSSSYGNSQEDSNFERRRNYNDQQFGNDQNQRRPMRGRQLEHNLFIINWNYAARGILYPRAVANIPIVATYVTRFINEKLLEQAQVDPQRIQLIGHSLGAHLAGFIGKNTRSKLGRIYGLDPAGPCFGTISGSLYPSNKRLAPSDAEEVITIHTNSALLGIDKPIGKYSVYVEGGAVQPGCKGGGVFKSLSTLSWEGGDFDTIACSHSRAPNLLTYRHNQYDTQDDCQLVAYECKDWDSYVAGHCGRCEMTSGTHSNLGSWNFGNSNSGNSNFANYNYGQDQYYSGSDEGPFRPVECLRLGLDWQYPKAQTGGHGNEWQRPNTSRSTTHSYEGFGRETSNYGSSYTSSRRPGGYNHQHSTSRRPTDPYGTHFTTSGHDHTREDQYGRETSGSYGNPYSSTQRPGGWHQGGSLNNSSQNGNPYVQDTHIVGNPHSSTRRPFSQYGGQYTTSSYDRDNGSSYENRRTSTSNRPSASGYSNREREKEKREAKNTTDKNQPTSRANSEDSVKVKTLFLRTGDTQPYCSYQYQIILELNEPFKKKPHMSLVLQDSEPESAGRRSSTSGSEKRAQNSLSSDEFGNKYSDRIYTHLLTGSKKLGKVDHATLICHEGLPDGHRVLKALHVNYMSHSDPKVRKTLSARLCPVKKEVDRENGSTQRGGNRFYFEPCGGGQSSDLHG